MEKKSCLVLTGDEAEMDGYFEEIARHALRRFPVHLLSNSEHVQIPGERVRTVVAVGEMIEESDFLLVNITQHTADLMYSIGYAHALGKLAMFYVHERANNDIPKFLAGYIYRVYGSSHELEELLTNDVNRYLSRELDGKSKI